MRSVLVILSLIRYFLGLYFLSSSTVLASFSKELKLMMASDLLIAARTVSNGAMVGKYTYTLASGGFTFVLGFPLPQLTRVRRVRKKTRDCFKKSIFFVNLNIVGN